MHLLTQYNNLIYPYVNNKLKYILLFSLIYKRQDVIRILYNFVNNIRYGGYYFNISNTIKYYIQRLPPVRRKIDKKVLELKTDITEETSAKQHRYIDDIDYILPEYGIKSSNIIKRLEHIKSKNLTKNDQVSGTIYNGEETKELIEKVYPLFYKSNPLHPDVFPELCILEKNIINMVKKLFNGDDNCVGCMTHGGTESILLACYSYKNLGLSKGIINPEMIIPFTAHAAFDKAASYFGIKLHKAPVDYETYELDLSFVENHINNRTIALVGSAPNYSHGIIDPIEDLSDIAIRYNIPLHVDACMGGFLLPFIDNLEFNYDFSLPGVTSISADTHKYGYCPKGSSIILYRNSKLYENQIFVEDKWDGGIYATNTIMGSKSGNNIAVTWAILNYYGKYKYTQYADTIKSTTIVLRDRLKQVADIEIIGDPSLNIVAFTSKKYNIYKINKYMTKFGWNLNELQSPAAIHICITMNNISEKFVDNFIFDIKRSIKTINNTADVENDNGSSIYGSSQKISDRSIIKGVAKHYVKLLSN